MESFTLDIIAPGGRVYTQDVTMATIPGEQGYFGVMANHAPFAAAIKPGLLDVMVDEKYVAQFYIEGGYVHVSPSSTVVMADYALNLKDVAEDALKQRLKELDAENAEYMRITTLLDVLSYERARIQQ